MSGFSTVVNLNSTATPVVITPTGSPFAWANPTTGPVLVIVSGGTVTAINLVVDGVDYLVGLVAGAFVVRAGASIKVAYAVAPTMTYVRL